jgi:hypothetical protein
MHGSLVTSSLIRETTENESANEGYRFGQEEVNLVLAVVAEVVLLGGAEYYRITNGLDSDSLRLNI